MADGEPKRHNCDTPPRKKRKIKHDQNTKRNMPTNSSVLHVAWRLWVKCVRCVCV